MKWFSCTLAIIYLWIFSTSVLKAEVTQSDSLDLTVAEFEPNTRCEFVNLSGEVKLAWDIISLAELTIPAGLKPRQLKVSFDGRALPSIEGLQDFTWITRDDFETGFDVLGLFQLSLLASDFENGRRYEASAQVSFEDGSKCYAQTSFIAKLEVISSDALSLQSTGNRGSRGDNLTSPSERDAQPNENGDFSFPAITMSDCSLPVKIVIPGFTEVESQGFLSADFKDQKLRDIFFPEAVEHISKEASKHIEEDFSMGIDYVNPLSSERHALDSPPFGESNQYGFTPLYWHPQEGVEEYFGIGIEYSRLGIYKLYNYLALWKKQHPDSTLVVLVDELVGSGLDKDPRLGIAFVVPLYGAIILPIMPIAERSVVSKPGGNSGDSKGVIDPITIEQLPYDRLDFKEGIAPYDPDLKLKKEIDSSLAMTLAHEIGHIFTLGHHSSTSTSVDGVNLMSNFPFFEDEYPPGIQVDTLVAAQSCLIRRMCFHPVLMNGINGYGSWPYKVDQFECGESGLERDEALDEECEFTHSTDQIDTFFYIECAEKDPGLWTEIGEGTYGILDARTPYNCYKEYKKPGPVEYRECRVIEFCGDGFYDKNIEECDDTVEGKGDQFCQTLLDEGKIQGFPEGSIPEGAVAFCYDPDPVAENPGEPRPPRTPGPHCRCGVISPEPTPTPTPDPCGNGEPDPGEECDPPGRTCTGGAVCNLDTCECELDQYCGNGIWEPGEECDVGSGDEIGLLSGGDSCEPGSSCHALSCRCLPTPCSDADYPQCNGTCEDGGTCKAFSDGLCICETCGNLVREGFEQCDAKGATSDCAPDQVCNNCLCRAVTKQPPGTVPPPNIPIVTYTCGPDPDGGQCAGSCPFGTTCVDNGHFCECELIS